MKLVCLVLLVFSFLVSARVTDDSYQQIMVALTGMEGEMVVSWVTFSPTAQSLVAYGLNEKVNGGVANGTSELFVDPQPQHTSRYIHSAILTGLKRSVRYYYQVGDGQSWGPVLSFKNIPPGNQVVNLAVYGDFGNANAQSLTNLIEEVRTEEIDMVLHVGDFAYDLHTNDGTVGDAFLNAIQPIASAVPYMGCLGNHEGKYNFSHFNYRFKLWEELGKNSGSGANNWFFSWEYTSGNAVVHMVAITTEVYYIYVDEYKPPNLTRQMEDQYAWLQKDLSLARSKGVDWVIVYGHRPMYCSNVDDMPDCSSDAETLRKGVNFTYYGMEEILGTFDVDIYFTAHEHSYERTFPVYQGKFEGFQANHTHINPKFPVHIISGSAGCIEEWDYYDEVFYGPWSVVRSSTYGYGHLQIYNSTHLYWEQLLDEGRAEKDYLWIVKSNDSF